MDGRLVSMKVSVSERARDIIHQECEREGVTLGAMIEAFAEMVEAGGDNLPAAAGTLYPIWMGRARIITSARRRRQGQSG